MLLLTTITNIFIGGFIILACLFLFFIMATLLVESRKQKASRQLREEQKREENLKYFADKFKMRGFFMEDMGNIQMLPPPIIQWQTTWTKPVDWDTYLNEPDLEAQLRESNEALDIAIIDESYEYAAVLRDKIKTLEEQIANKQQEK